MDDEQQVKLPLTQFVKDVAREAALAVIKEHVESCAVVKVVNKLDTRIGTLEDKFDLFDRRFHVLLCAIVGSGALGGSVGALIMQMFG